VTLEDYTNANPADFQVATVDENESLSFRTRGSESAQIDQRIFAINDARGCARMKKKIAPIVVALTTSVGTLRDSTAASYPKFSLVGCVLH